MLKHSADSKRARVQAHVRTQLRELPNQGMVITQTSHGQRQEVGRSTSKLGMTYAYAVPVRARRDCVSRPCRPALYSQPGEQRHQAVMFPLPFFPQMLSKMVVYTDSGLQCLCQLVTSRVLATVVLH